MSSEFGEIPSDDVEPIDAIVALAAGRPLTPVWRNSFGGLTFQIGSGPNREFVKWAPAGSELDLAAEAERLEWAAPFTPVPRVLSLDADDFGSWLVTSGLRGQSAVAPRWTADPASAVVAAGKALRAFHDALPVQDCPFSWGIERRRAAKEPQAVTPQQKQTLAALADHPPIERLVVCHGDPTVPNTLLVDDGTWSGHVDLGWLGVADRWADLAIATWSTVWNYGPGWEQAYLDAYGVNPDPVRTKYYRTLWYLDAYTTEHSAS